MESIISSASPRSIVGLAGGVVLVAMAFPLAVRHKRNGHWIVGPLTALGGALAMWGLG